jgi:carboxymethylenebutenolidase
MKRRTTIVTLLVSIFGLSLVYAAKSNLGARLSNSETPLAPRGSSDGGFEAQSTATPCPGLRECTVAENDLPAQLQVAFPGPNNMTLHGHLYVPGVRTMAELAAVRRKFPVMIYNHGSEADPKGVPHLAKLYVDHSFVFFAPDRHGQGLSKDAGPYIADLQKAAHNPEAAVKLHELYNLDVIAAVKWIKEQRYTDRDHIAMTGISYGGIQTLLTAEKDPGIRVYLPFTPAAQSWGNVALQQRLIAAVRSEKAPMFLIQATGDYNLGPSETLGPILRQKGNQQKWTNKIYPQFGCTNQEAHGRFASQCDGIAIWEDDVLNFLNQVGEL